MRPAELLLTAALLAALGAGCRRVEAIPPKAIHAVAPVYPEAARRRAVQGVVTLRVLVGPDGTVRQVRVTRSIPELDAAAVAAVRQWTFRPGTIGGRKVAVWIDVPVRFSGTT